MVTPAPAAPGRCERCGRPSVPWGRAAVYAVLAVGAAALLYVVGVTLRWTVFHHDDGEEWGFTNFAVVVDGVAPFERRWAESAPGEDAWVRAVALLDAEGVSERARRTLRLGVDETARIAALYAPRGPVAALLADGQTARVWSRDLVERIRRDPHTLTWSLGDPRVEWKAISEARR